jgi:hypothetical protein
MGTITYKNEAVAFTADYHDLIDQLNKNIREHNVEDDGILLKWLRDKTGNGKNDISITESIAYPPRILFLICDLMENETGISICKQCKKQYPPDEIIKHLSTPFSRNISPNSIRKLKQILKKEFGISVQINIPGSGGKSFLCPEGHILLSVRTWII